MRDVGLMCFRPKANPAYSYEPEPMEPDGKPAPMAKGDMPEPMGGKPGPMGGRPEPMGGRPERGGRPEQGGRPERGGKPEQGGRPERGGKPELAGDKPVAVACRVHPEPLPQQRSTTRLKLKTRNYFHA